MSSKKKRIAHLLYRAIEHHHQGELSQAAALYQQILTIHPRHSDAHHLLSLTAAQTNNYPRAEQLVKQAITIDPSVPTFYNTLGNILVSQHRLEEAIPAYRQAILLNPSYVEPCHNLANVLTELHQLPEAIEVCQQALEMNPSYAPLYTTLGKALRKQGQLAQAVMYYRQALTLFPQDAYTLCELGITLWLQGQLTEAMSYYQRALTPHDANIHHNLALVFRDQGLIEQAIKHHRHALVLQPESAVFHSGLLLTLHYHSEDPQALFQEHQKFKPRFPILSHTNTPHSERRLKIGYVSPDFREHSVAYFIEPLLAHHDHQQFEIFCFYTHQIHDSVTHRLQTYADHWIPCTPFSDEELAQRIRQERIDILVDLSGHTANHRLLVFARKPAPIQITYLGYVNTTGLNTIDYRIVDNATDPEPLFSEIPIKMPHSYCCYHPIQETPKVNDLPALQNGYVTFGSFNNYAKLSQKTLDLWAQILKALPTSKMMIKTKSLSDPNVCQTLKDHFNSLGVSPDRLIVGYLPSTQETLHAYHEIDIMLDSYPYHGCTTTCQSLWMGVPVVTLLGKTHAARVGLSFLSSVGLDEWVAYMPEDYVNLCVKFAQDESSLQILRQKLREQMQLSPLMDARSLTSHLEGIYREKWKIWCAKRPCH